MKHDVFRMFLVFFIFFFVYDMKRCVLDWEIQSFKEKWNKCLTFRK